MNDASGVAPAGRYADSYLTVRDGLRLHYRDYPGAADKPPLLCLPGLTRNARDFADLAERYSPRFRVIALDFRGRAASDYDPVPARYNPMTYAGDVIELLDKLGISEAIFVGTSLGGLVTMVIAATASQRIAAAIINDVGPDVDPGGISRILTYVGKDVRFKSTQSSSASRLAICRLIAEAATLSWDEAADTISANNGGNFERFSHADWVAMAKRNCREEDGEIRFDYDMAIAEPFRTSGPAPKVDLWPLFGVPTACPATASRRSSPLPPASVRCGPPR